MSFARHARRRRSPRAGVVRPVSGDDLGAALEATRVFDRKAQQLCAQAQRALAFAFESQCGDEVLAGLVVEAVVPMPTCARLLVVLRPYESVPDRDEVLRRLRAARGHLRAQVANAIHRKRTPELAFELLPGPGAVREEDES